MLNNQAKIRKVLYIPPALLEKLDQKFEKDYPGPVRPSKNVFLCQALEEYVAR